MWRYPNPASAIRNLSAMATGDGLCVAPEAPKPPVQPPPAAVYESRESAHCPHKPKIQAATSLTQKPKHLVGNMRQGWSKRPSHLAPDLRQQILARLNRREGLSRYRKRNIVRHNRSPSSSRPHSRQPLR